MDAMKASVYLGMTLDALYTAVSRRKVPFRWQGRKLVFDKEELDAYMHQLDGVTLAEAVSRILHNGIDQNLPNEGLT